MWEDLDSEVGYWARNNIREAGLYNTYLKAVLKRILDKVIQTNTVGIVCTIGCLFNVSLHGGSWYVDQ